MLSVFLLFMRGNCFSSSLMFIEVPPVEYWEIVAEQRRKALLEALEENKMVRCQAIFIYSILKGVHSDRKRFSPMPGQKF